jgi:hypothetical protein
VVANRRVILSSALGFASALGLLVLAFVVGLELRAFSALVWAPGEFLVRASDALCPPFGVECFLGSRRQGAHHLWRFICSLGAWGAVLSVAWWYGLRYLSRPNARAA